MGREFCRIVSMTKVRQILEVSGAPFPPYTSSGRLTYANSLNIIKLLQKRLAIANLINQFPPMTATGNRKQGPREVIFPRLDGDNGQCKKGVMTISKRLAILVLLVLVSLVFTLAGCSSGQGDVDAIPEEETTLERVQREGYIEVGFANEAPFAYATPEGKLTGLNVEIAREILHNLGVTEINGVLTEFGSLIPGLKAKRFDIITAGMYLTPDRAKEVTFANPEYTIGGGLAVQAGNPYNLHSYYDIAENPEVKVAVMAGAAEYDHLLAVGVSEAQIITVPDQPAALAELQAGRADAITMTSAALNSLLATIADPDIERVEDFEIAVVDGKSQQAFGSAAFRHEDTDFVEAYNRELEKLKESGRLLEIFQEFGFTEHELPGDVTAAEALEMW